MGLEGWLSGIREDLRAKTYRPEPVRRAMVPKPGGGERPLGIPTIRDREVQGAVNLVIEPIFEADLEPSSYGYRPKRSAGDAVQAVHKLLCRGYTDVVDAVLSKYFDTIPHAELMQSVARRIVDRNVQRLINLWLKTPVEETDGDGKRRMTGGRGSTCGTPQGGIVSPLLAVLYMNRFLKYWRITGQGTRFRAEVVNYADDLVILSRGHAREAMAWTRQVMTRLGLTLNEAKTSVRDGRKESFDLLGYSFGPQRFRKDGHWYLGASPSRKSVARLKLKVRGLLRPGNQAPWPEVRDQLNSVLRGWSHYFGYRTSMDVFEISPEPVVFSLALPLALWDTPRNIRDDQIKACAKSGGVIGFNGCGAFLGDNITDTETMLRHIDYLAKLVGPQHVGIGLDYVSDSMALATFMGADWGDTKFADPEQLPEITEGLLGRGYPEVDVRGILGENWLNLAHRVWK